MLYDIVYFPGALTIVADFMGAIGSGTGILLAVTIIYQYAPLSYHPAPDLTPCPAKVLRAAP